MRILIAEDDLTSRMMLQAILSQWGYETCVAVDGFEAWQLLSGGQHPDVAILDWEMPGMDGVELCRRLRRLDLDIPVYVILLTGRDTKEDIVAGLDSGADDYMVKPFDDNELRARIRVAERMIAVQKDLAGKIGELQDALEHVKVLQGVLPICMHCHKIRNDNQAWDRLEAYISQHSDAKFSHSICPACYRKHYPEEDGNESIFKP